MSEPVTQKLPLRHPAEIPMFIFMVVLNFAILAVLIDFLVSVALIPTELRGTNWEPTIACRARSRYCWWLRRSCSSARFSEHRSAVRPCSCPALSSRTCTPPWMTSPRTLGVKPTPAIYLGNGNGTLNAFAAQSGWTNNYVVLSNELFANLRNDNREGTRFILGHETAHIRLHHVALWYNLVLCYSQLIPILGPTLSRLREYSCDRNGAAARAERRAGTGLADRR